MWFKSVLIGVLGSLIALAAAPAAPGGAPAKKSPYLAVSMGWQLSNATVVSKGQAVQNRAGTLIEGYRIESQATALTRVTPVQSGTFRLNLTLFSPARDLPGQKAGVWYIRGPWQVTDVKATDKEKKTRHSPTVLKGELSAELAFNPLAAPGTIEAAVRLPGSPAGGFLWSRGGGGFSGNGKFEGVMQLNAYVLPDTKGVRK